MRILQIQGLRLFNSSINTVLTIYFGYDITILKMAILYKFNNIEIAPTLCDLGTATASDLQTLINTWATVHFHPNISSHHAINNTLEYME